MGSYVLKVREQREVYAALSDLKDSNGNLEGVQEFCRSICKTIGADFMVLTVPDAEDPRELTWIETRCRPPLMQLFPREVAANDFVFAYAMNQQGMVVRDQEMMNRRLLHRTPLYSLSVDARCPLERVQAWITVAADGIVVGGAMHRTQDRAFQERERIILEQVIHPLNKIMAHSTRLAMAQTRWRRNREQRGEAIVLFDSKGKELARTDHVDIVVRKWFANDELDRTGLPQKILDELHSRMLLQNIQYDNGQPWVRPTDIAKLRVWFTPQRTGEWEVIFEEQSHRIDVPQAFVDRYRLSQLHKETLVFILNNPHADEKTLAKIMNCSGQVAHERVRRLREKFGEMVQDGIPRSIHRADLHGIVNRFVREDMR